MKSVPVFFLFLVGSVVSIFAEDAAPKAEQPASTPATGSSRPHLISGDAAAALAAERPKFDPTAATKNPKETPIFDVVGGTIHLPAQIVVTGKLPPLDERALYTATGLNDLALRRYDSAADRKLIEEHPVLAGLLRMYISTDGQNGPMQMYEDDERLRHIEATSRVIQAAQAAGDKAGSEELTREAQQTYARRFDMGRVDFRK